MPACDGRAPPSAVEASPEFPAAVWITLDADTVYVDAAMTSPLGGARWMPGRWEHPPREPHFPAWIYIESDRTSGRCRYAPTSDASAFRWLRDDVPQDR